MRGLVTALFVSAFLMQPALAQGIKDPANFPVTQSTKKTTTQTTQTASRPTAIRNLSGTGVTAQGVWKDGKLTAVPR
ncbi:hypothetical protein IC762_12695 [Bradyrhizobium genosp. L]|uniref:hypothetical protein n=1 Tax=Bradyrhizobium genosp. L TaxID=83637 RepID=UPI0018A27037|nr:hypothetical protein [Bradyrhizobium genosp. L]QPF87099.1 hypothetical protein IC762_12695 [Bradyrhizobium genosp. L]